MSAPANYVPAACSLTAMGVWGVSDFIGGLGARRANAFLFTSIVHAGGMAVMGTLALTLHDALPERNSVLWALAAGSIGGISLACFYRALASGKWA